MTEPVTRDNLPYLVTENDTVLGRLKTFKVLGGPRIAIFIPDPKGPDEGWKPGQYDTYMRELHNAQMPMLRATFKQHYGTTSFRLESDMPHEVPLKDAIELHAGMLARQEGAEA